MSTVTAPTQRTFFGHPAGLSTLFFTEFWERFSYYGMRALLVLYLVAPPDGATPPGPGLGMDTATASAIYGTYVALVYLFPLLGGWIADRMWGFRRAVLVGGIVIACGHYAMAVPLELTFWLGLLLIALGTGLLKPNISAMVGELYHNNDAKRDAGFSVFYMGINLGAFIAPLVTGALMDNFGWHYAFGAAAIGMTIGVIQYVVGGRKTLAGIGLTAPNPASPTEKRNVFLILGASVGGIVAMALLDAWLFGFEIADMVDILAIFILLVPIVYFVRMFRTPGMSKEQTSRLHAFLGLFIGAAIFWMIYDQAGSTLSVFAEESTDLTVGGFTIPVPWLQSINPIFIIIFAPIFAAIWSRLGDRAPSTPLKFAWALLGIGISFLIMIPPALDAETGAEVAVWWLVGVYLIQTWAELLLSPIGLSASTRLAPPGMEGQMLALWFLAVSVGDTIGAQILARIGNDYVRVFTTFGLMAVGASVIAFLFVPRLKRMMAGVH
ncbi:MAG TPA: oligopeptide:H+ symporter [Actinomycetota bacterium]|jgi:POT family proton-dependent oligopeptide transporter|nr:oligopeptide:H+ symporter [Actinomycetota bacterium]